MRPLLGSAWGLAAAGAVIAFFATMCGIGGGLFCVPLLHFAVGLPLRRAVATGLCLVFVNAVASTVTELTRSEPRLELLIVVVTVVGAVLGAELGYKASRRISTRALRGLFAVVLAIAGLRIALAGGAEARDLGPASGKALIFAVSLGAGLGGGFLAPLLGIGGGLVVVPVLFLGIDGLGFGGARACSMAVAIATGARSLRLFAREGAVDWTRGRALGAGAVLGAVAGVVLVHQPGWTDTARVLLGACLLFVSLRFVWELIRDGRAGRAQA